MKRFFLLSLSLACISFVQAQNPLQKVLKSYFRSHPFDTRFSSFITSLQKDPWFTIEEYSRRTDTSFFYLTGTYKNFNPFRYQAKEVRLIIAEVEFIHADSLKTLDTIINIQLMKITDTGIADKTAVSKEFSRFHKNHFSGFWKNNYDNFKSKGEMIAEVYHYFIYPFSIPPVTVAWGSIPASKEYTFTITLRCKVKQNIADLIMPPDGL
jgi:hypothetical protein